MRDLPPPEPAAPLHSLRQFARDLAVPEEVAVAVYERELTRLREGARIEGFVCILAEKRAKHALKNGRTARPAAAEPPPPERALPAARPGADGAGRGPEGAKSPRAP